MHAVVSDRLGILLVHRYAKIQSWSHQLDVAKMFYDSSNDSILFSEFVTPTGEFIDRAQ